MFIIIRSAAKKKIWAIYKPKWITILIIIILLTDQKFINNFLTSIR